MKDVASQREKQIKTAKKKLAFLVHTHHLLNKLFVTFFKFCKLTDCMGSKICVLAGLEIATNTVAFATKFFPLRLKYLEKSQICDLLSPSFFRNKRVSSCHFAATFAKINK